SMFVLPSVPAVDGFSVEYSIDGGGWTSNPSTTAPGCHTVQARYVPSAVCGITPAGSAGPGDCTESNIVEVVIFPAAPTMAVPASTCDAPLAAITPVPDLTGSGFDAEYAVQAPGAGMSAYGSLAAANALLANTPGCWAISARYVLQSACGSSPAGSLSSDPGCQERTVFAVVYPTAPVISEPAPTCAGALPLPAVPP